MNPSSPSGEVECVHCRQRHPGSWSHCPSTGRPLSAGQALVGRVIAERYRITALLGEGGMGAVYAAEHIALGRRVAIKRMHPELAEDERSVARFQREARTAAATGHENVVDVLDLGFAEDGAPYLVMEYLRGESLAKALKRQGRLPVKEACYVLGQVLGALSAVHRKGIVHRDLKPDNIFLTRRSGRSDYVKVLDFGVSKIRGESEVSSLTRTGVMLGTPHYMSAEQARGQRNLDYRVDIYAAGVILYECLSGFLPFEGNNYHALLQAILSHQPRPLSQRAPHIPQGLERIVHRAMAAKPADRFESAREMLLSLVPHGAKDHGDLDLARDSSPPEHSMPTAVADAEMLRERANYVHQHKTELAPAPAPKMPPREPAPRPRPGPPARPRAEPMSTGPQRRDSGMLPAFAFGLNEEGDAPRPAMMAKVPRAFVACSEDWLEAGARPSGREPTGTIRLPPRRSRLSTGGARPSSPLSDSARTPPPRRSTPSSTPLSRRSTPTSPRTSSARGLQVRGSVVLLVLDHIRRERSTSRLDILLQRVPSGTRERLSAPIQPTAWCAASDLELLLAAAESRTGSTSFDCGLALARADLPIEYRIKLRDTSSTAATELLPALFRHYHSGATLSVLPSSTSSVRVRLSGLQSPARHHMLLLAGFCQALLELVGAGGPKAAVLSSPDRQSDVGEILLRWW